MSIRFASIGTGWIAGEFLKGAREVEGLEYIRDVELHPRTVGNADF